MKKLFVVLGVLLFVGCMSKQEQAPSKSKVHTVLDNWHKAAAEADFDRYFNYFASDSAIFMGTDATERWTISEFKPWSKPYFDRGEAWSFVPVQRHIYFSKAGRTAWFDESLDTPNLGPARGTGVLIKKDTTWKITHYNLSIPIPNAIADTVVEQVERALADTTDE